ncbi:hypothetical protein [unidentified bacterial endosymbiont]|uniref:hypothetical protein n=1 Tax=unidentified bacterial endosymbiont TaxID=2355 RepID=UPI0020A03813|nr:hypothetical protein [unidentified bacterial endosymbiont]
MFDYRNTLTPEQDSILAVFNTRKGDRSYQNSVLAMADSIVAHPNQVLDDKGPKYLATLAWVLGDLAGREETCVQALESLSIYIMQRTNAMRVFNPRELILVANGITRAAGSRWSPPIINAINEIVRRLNDRDDLITREFMPNMLADTVNSLSRLAWLDGPEESIVQLNQIATMISQRQYDLDRCSIQDLSCILQGLTSVLPDPVARGAINLIAEHLLVNWETAVLQGSPQHLLNLQQNLVESIGLANMPSVAPAISRIAELMSQDGVSLTTLEPNQLVNLAHTLSEVLSLPHVPGAVHSMARYINSESLNLELLSPAQLATLTTSFLAALSTFPNPYDPIPNDYRRNHGRAIAKIAFAVKRVHRAQETLINTEDVRHLFLGFVTTAHIIEAERTEGIFYPEDLRTLRNTATVFSNSYRNLREDINAFNPQNLELPSARLGLAGSVMEELGALPIQGNLRGNPRG